VLAPYLSETYYQQVLRRVHRFVQGLEREAAA
jgi:hypothetical protein